MEGTREPAAAAGVRLLALDVGSRRVGVAICGRVGAMVEPLFTMMRKGDRPDAKAVGRLVRKHGAAGVVVGHPLRLSGEKSGQTLRVERFASVLEETLEVPVFLHDERLSTVAAGERLSEAERESRDRGVVDQVAAAVILEGFLLHRAHLEAMARARQGDMGERPERCGEGWGRGARV